MIFHKTFLTRGEKAAATATKNGDENKIKTRRRIRRLATEISGAIIIDYLFDLLRFVCTALGIFLHFLLVYILIYFLLL